MRQLQVTLLLAACLSLCACSVGSSQPAPARWTTGFWFWQGSSVDPAYSGQQVDALFVQVGTLQKRSVGWARLEVGGNGEWHAYASLPDRLPPAREVWLVWRFDGRGVPDVEAVAPIVEGLAGLLHGPRSRRLNIAGIQLDIDSPTSDLPQYAVFLRELRERLPAGMRISITALLDWFRDGAGIDRVIAQTDEFVPQFYDLGDPAGAGDYAIAARIDAARWGPVFNRLGKPFRIGISCFGRARVLLPEGPNAHARRLSGLYGSLRPLDVALNPALQLNAPRNPAGEIVLTYRATRKTQIAYERLEPGGAIEFVVPTPEAIRDAVDGARRMAGRATGVVLFRWPSEQDGWAMQPEEALDAAGASAAPRRQDRVEVVPGECAAVHCADVYLDSAAPLSARVLRYRVRASKPLEYFLPERKLVRSAGGSVLDVSIPPYCGRGRLYLGRAVSASPVEFAVEEVK
jgi:hypothetical protein